MQEEPETFQLLVQTEGLAPGELLWIGNGAMKPLGTTAEALAAARLIPADGWTIACGACHPKDTEEFLRATGQRIVKDERKVQILIAALSRTQPVR